MVKLYKFFVHELQVEKEELKVVHGDLGREMVKRGGCLAAHRHLCCTFLLILIGKFWNKQELLFSHVSKIC